MSCKTKQSDDPSKNRYKHIRANIRKCYTINKFTTLNKNHLYHSDRAQSDNLNREMYSRIISIDMKTNGNMSREFQQSLNLPKYTQQN